MSRFPSRSTVGTVAFLNATSPTGAPLRRQPPEVHSETTTALPPPAATSPVDGRYGSRTAALPRIASGYGLSRHRAAVEVRRLRALAQCPVLDALEPLGEAAEGLLGGGLARGFSRCP